MATIRPTLERRLQGAIAGEATTDAFARGRYATDASFYQVMPAAVAVPKSAGDVAAIIEIAGEDGVAVTARGGGTSQCGQTVNSGIIVDTSKYMNRLTALDAEARTCRVEPGIVLDELNRQLEPHGLWLPVDISTASRATIGGMVGNNSCGTRSLRYGKMRDHVASIDAVLADGRLRKFGEVAAAPGDGLETELLALGREIAPEVAARFPKVHRRVGGYNLDALAPGPAPPNLAHLLVGSEGSLAFSTEIELKLAPLMGPRVTGVCHFGSFRGAMEATRHIVALGPVAVELIDAGMIALGREIPLYREALNRIVKGEPAALLAVEFADTEEENSRKLTFLADLIGDCGFAWSETGAQWGGVVALTDPAQQAALTEVRQGALNIMMSMKDEGKPVSFIEDCAVPLEHLADYTEMLTAIFARHGTRGTWYAHASEGCLHVRPILNLKQERDRTAMRAIAEAAFEAVRGFRGSHSGEHGDGILRSEFHEKMFGPKIVRSFEAIKERFDPKGILNPGRIVRPPRFDDHSLFRYGPDYRVDDLQPSLSWSGWPGAGGGFQGAVEMCNNNGACRALKGAVMCPSYRVTRNERDVTRGRANTLRLAITGQLGPDALASEAMAETMKLCVSCKACKRECPTGVDMARMKIEVMAARAEAHGISRRDRLIAFLPRYAERASHFGALLNMANGIPGAGIARRALGFAGPRWPPRWAARPFRRRIVEYGPAGGPEVALFADTFTTWFEPGVAEAALRVLVAAGYRVLLATPMTGGDRPLCCGRTFLAAGLVDEAKYEARRTMAALAPLARRGVPIVGLEPSCLLTFRDELTVMLPGADSNLVASAAMLFEEFVAREAFAGRFEPTFAPADCTALLHGHCHQKAHGTIAATEAVLGLVPGLDLQILESGCCGMAGAFGYQAETYDISMEMGESGLLPAVREAAPETVIIADGTSCRHQIGDGAGRRALHVAEFLAKRIVAAKPDAD